MTILCDLSQIISATVFMGDAHECAKHACDASKNMIKHSVFNSIRANYMAHKGTYGKMILACDDSSWRYDVFPQYKHDRKIKKDNDTSGINWEFVDSVKAELISDLDQYFPFTVLKIRKVEGDDIIGVLTPYLTLMEKDDQEADMFGNVEVDPILIISSDGDNFQLHKYKNVKQWSPMAKKLVRPDGKPRNALLEKIVKGDKGDGVMNIKMPDNTFVEKIRQQSITEVFLEKFYASSNPIEICENEDQIKNYKRNELLVSYEKIPQNYQDLIILMYNEKLQSKHSKMGLVNYLIANKMTNLLSNVYDFY